MDDFRGHFNRGLSDDIPKNFLRDTLNLRFSTGEMRSREGSTLSISQSNIVRFHPYKRLNENPRYLILDSSGNLYDSIAGLIHTDAAWLDFNVLNFNNFAYITPHNRISGITGQKVWVYDGTTFRRAGEVTGISTSTALGITAGNIEAGTHVIAYATETSSGYISTPTIVNSFTFSANGTLSFTLSGSFPAGMVAVHVLATKVIPNYDGNQTGHTFYFIPTGRLTTIGTVSLSFFDVELFNSADYLFDQFDFIPAGLGLTDYNGRIVLWGVPGSEHIVYLSKSTSPESFDQINGFVTVFPSDNASGIKGCWAQRGNLYIRKAGSTYQTTDNGQDPVTWVPNNVDYGIGGEVYCGSTIIDKDDASSDKMFIAHLSGLYTFQGSYSKPDLSYNIANEWKRINRSKFNLVNVIHDPTTYSIYVLVPLDSTTVISHILYCDYSEALDPLGFIIPKDCKWSIWVFPSNLSHAIADYDNNNNVLFKYSLASGNIYYLDTTVRNDFSNVIHAYGSTYLIGEDNESVDHFALLRLRARGSGNLLITLYGEDEVLSLSPTPLVLTALPGKSISRKINFVNERCSIKLEVNSADDWFNISRLILFANEQFLERPT